MESTSRMDASVRHCFASLFSFHLERGVVVAALALLVVLVCCHQGAQALPAYDILFKIPADQPTSIFSDDNECHLSSEVETLCQRCAKSTKSNVVYPMCCDNTEEAREWCRRYMNFGIQ